MHTSKRDDGYVAVYLNKPLKTILSLLFLLSCQVERSAKDSYGTEQWLLLSGQPWHFTAHTYTYTAQYPDPDSNGASAADLSSSPQVSSDGHSTEGRHTGYSSTPAKCVS